MAESSSTKGIRKSFVKKILEHICMTLISRDQNFAKTVLDFLISGKVFDKSGIILNLLKFNDCDVSDIMIHRKEIVALNASSTGDEVINAFSVNKHTRIPVYSDTIDNIIGFIHIKDVLGIVDNNEFSAKSIIREIVFVPPLMKAMDLLVKMKSAKVNVAVIVDEYGITEGLVTISSVVDKIVGETKGSINERQLVCISEFIFEVFGRTLIRDLEETSLVKLFEVDDMYSRFSTVGGLILSMVGRVPSKGEVITHESGVVFTIIESDERCVHKVLVDTSLKFRSE